MRVRVEAPSSPFPAEKLQAGAVRLQDAGFSVDTTHAGPRGRHAYLNGDDETRRTSLEDALRADVDLVWLARGGYGLTRLVEELRLPSPGARLPRLVGFSDATALLLHLAAHGHPGHVHGPLMTTVSGESDATFSQLMDVLYDRPSALDGLTSHAGAIDVSGPVFAANLCVLTHLIGTRSLPSFAGAILVIEEVGERPYRIDRMLTQLIASGALAGLGALVVGQLLDCEEKAAAGGSRDPAPRPLDVILERVAPLCPIVSGAPIGHAAPNHAIATGAPARLTGSGNSVRLALSPVGVG